MVACGTSWHTNVRGSSQIHLCPNCQLKEWITVLDNGAVDDFVGKTWTDGAFSSAEFCQRFFLVLQVIHG